MADLSRLLNLSPAAVSLCIKRGEGIMLNNGLVHIKSQN
jgi:hypothetical protein